MVIAILFEVKQKGIVSFNIITFIFFGKKSHDSVASSILILKFNPYNNSDIASGTPQTTTVKLFALSCKSKMHLSMSRFNNFVFKTISFADSIKFVDMFWKFDKRIYQPETSIILTLKMYAYTPGSS